MNGKLRKSARLSDGELHILKNDELMRIKTNLYNELFFDIQKRIIITIFIKYG